MNSHSIIPVKALVGPSLHTREAAHFVLKHASMHPCDQVELDFSGIDFISRSFADEFHFQKFRIATERQKDIIVSHAAPQVSQVLQSAARTQQAANSGKSVRIPVLKFASQRDFNYYLVSI